MQKSSKYYWWFQFSGWGLLTLLDILINILFGQEVNAQFFEQLAVTIFAGVLSTHLFRNIYTVRAGYIYR